MKLQFYRREALDALQKNIHENIGLYAEEKEEWTDSFFREKGIRVPLMTSDIITPDVDLLTGQGALQDIENAIRLHTAFNGILKPVQAADRRLWIALTHTVFYPYMIDRWPVEARLNENGTNGTVTDRYFASRGLLRNGISRLYWIAEYTYDASLEDPYEYTKFIIEEQDLTIQVEGRSLCRNKRVLQSCLKTLKEAGELSRQQKRLFFEGMCKRGGVRVLDALPEDVLNELCENTLDSVLNSKQVTEGSKVYLQSIDSGKPVIITIQNGKAFIGKTQFKSKPENLSQLSVGNEVELGKIRYRITDVK